MALLTDHHIDHNPYIDDVDADDINSTPDRHSSSPAYRRRFEGPVGAYLLERQTSAVMKLISPWQSARVLDVGGGHAQVASPLVAAGYDVTVLSSQTDANEQIHRMPGKDQLKLLVGALTNPPVQAQSYDVVTCLRMLSHIDDWQELIAGLCRSARHAVIFDYTPILSANFFAPLLFSLKKKVEGNTRRFSVFENAAIRKCLAENGFGVTHTVRQFFWPMAMHRVMKQPTLSRGLESASAAVGLRHCLGSPVIVCAQRLGDDAKTS